mmetsp:Transcript_22690/g.57488  ORF Transcript_22690/g.57488 Transcript_22690/m.57488 type:complete len:265 (-) Transcript_22690:680-1474(-)
MVGLVTSSSFWTYCSGPSTHFSDLFLNACLGENRGNGSSCIDLRIFEAGDDGPEGMVCGRLAGMIPNRLGAAEASAAPSSVRASSSRGGCGCAAPPASPSSSGSNASSSYVAPNGSSSSPPTPATPSPSTSSGSEMRTVRLSVSIVFPPATSAPAAASSSATSAVPAASTNVSIDCPPSSSSTAPPAPLNSSSSWIVGSIVSVSDPLSFTIVPVLFALPVVPPAPPPACDEDRVPRPSSLGGQMNWDTEVLCPSWETEVCSVCD